VELAHAAGLRVSVHVETAADFHVAVEAGVDEVNHLPGFRPEADVPIDRYRISESDAARAAEKGIVVVTTVSALIETVEGMPPEQAAVAARYRGLVMANLETLSRNGVKIAIGSDRYEKSSLDEALALSRLGVFENADLLQRWTRETARTIFPDREIGCLGEGCEASFLVLEANPLERFGAVERIRMRVKQGRPVELPEPVAVKTE
jgi:imidazolonepropionase-like amidohydrolase